MPMACFISNFSCGKQTPNIFFISKVLMGSGLGSVVPRAILETIYTMCKHMINIK